jgi:hypothetical protein
MGRSLGYENKMIIKNIIKSVFFSEESIESESKTLSAIAGLIAFFITAVIFVIPTNAESLRNLPVNFVYGALGYLIVNVLLYIFVSLIMGKVNFFKFFTVVNVIFMTSLLVIAVPAFLISYLLANIIFKNEILALFLFSLIPYYNLIFFGWLCEKTADAKNTRAVIIALFAITILWAYQNLLSLFVI